MTADPELRLALELPGPAAILSLSKPVIELGDDRGMGALMVSVLSCDGLASFDVVDEAESPLL